MAKSKYKIGDKVMITKSALYPDNSWLMGVVKQIHNSEGSFSYDIQFGITGIKDERNVLEEDLKAYE